MNVLYGLTKPDEGEILIDGKPVTFSSARRDRAGIGMVHQHFMLIPVMSVAENIVLGNEPRRALPRLPAPSARARALAAVRPGGRPTALDSGSRSAAAARRDPQGALPHAEILILDEPTAVLTPQETVELLAIVRTLRADGKSVIFITHKLDEVLEIADRITVLRRGRSRDRPAGRRDRGLAQLMVGREVLLRVDKAPATPGEPCSRCEDLQVLDDRTLETVRGVSFTCAPARSSASQASTATARRSSSRRSPACGVVSGHDRCRRPRRQGHRRRASSTPASGTSPRTGSGAARARVHLAENIALHDYDEPPVSRSAGSSRAADHRARDLIEEFDVRGGGPLTLAGAVGR